MLRVKLLGGEAVIVHVGEETIRLFGDDQFAFSFVAVDAPRRLPVHRDELPCGRCRAPGKGEGE